MHAQMSIIRDIIYAAVAHGADFYGLCEALDIDPADLNDSEKLVPFEPAARVWDVALEQTKDPLLGLHIGREISATILGMTGYLMENSRTLQEALIMFCKFNNLYSTMLEYSVTNEESRTRIQYQPHTMWEKKFPESARQSVEISMAGLLRLFYLMADRKIIPVKAELMYTKRYVREYESILGCPIEFGAERNALIFNSQELLSPINRHDVSLFSFFNNALQQKLAERSAQKGLTETIHDLILTKFKGRVPPIEIVASALCLTPRSLQRKLKEENTTFRNLGNEIKKELTTRLMGNTPVKVKDLAGLLGYSDSSAFRKAFKKWNQRS
ncbi:MAG: AraC family transcriptional regulator ligand-binding domain-containing protein [Cyclobacteriaceae bacterium]|nr:AraC family transcriptional regulator ligand-binding domain-containing protein [Cyclobacteriaceae bacterium]